MERERTLWSDGRLDNFSHWMKSDVARVEREMRSLRQEVSDLRTEEWKKRHRRINLILVTVYLLSLGLLIAAILENA
jgi:hypothetical protein